MHSGVAVGAIIRYVIVPAPTKTLRVVLEAPQSASCDGIEEEGLSPNTLTVGEVLYIETQADSFSCSVDGKLFKNREGNFIQDSVCHCWDWRS